MSDFNKILRQQCNNELQTNRKMSLKYVNKRNSYNGFSADTQNQILWFIYRYIQN